jgi:cytochrome c553
MAWRAGLILLATVVSVSACGVISQGAARATAGQVQLPAPEVAHRARYKQVPGSTRQYTQAHIDNYYAAPDWFPDQHPPMPRLVSHGDGGKVQACAACHLTSGLGHPESGNLAGLPQSYLVRQMVEYKNRSRFERSPMYAMAAAMSEKDMQEVSAYFSTLKPVRSTRVQEVDTVPQTVIHPTLRMRQVVPNGVLEPINGRLIEVPESPELVEMRDPRAGFVAYAPRGSIALGKLLATEGGGRTVACAACHGDQLKGTAEVPRLAGLSPDYVLRQLRAFKSGDRHGEQAAAMQPAVVNLTVEDMIALSTYVGTLDAE